jgi:hypothetical protein
VTAPRIVSCTERLNPNYHKSLPSQTTTCGPSRTTYLDGPVFLARLRTTLQVALFYIFQQAYFLFFFLFRFTTVTKLFTSSSSPCYLHFLLDQLQRHLIPSPSSSSSFLPSVSSRLSCYFYIPIHCALIFVLFFIFCVSFSSSCAFFYCYSSSPYLFYCTALFRQTATDVSQLSFALEMSTRIPSYWRTATKMVLGNILVLSGVASILYPLFLT